MPYLTSEDFKKCEFDGKTLIIHKEKVYDVTKFVNVHPGGQNVLKLRHGKDVTKIMKSGPHTHSKNAYRWLDQYYVADYCEKDMMKHSESNGTNGVIQANGSATTEKHDLINWDEPVLWQVGYMGAKYHDWVDDPVDKPLRLFKSDFCEFFSSTPWYVIPLVWLPVVAMFITRSYNSFVTSNVHLFAISAFQVPLSSMPIIFVMGCFSWTLAEYSLHRWLFHRDPPTTSYYLITLHFLLHGQHHKVPFDSGRLVFPPVPAAVIGINIYIALRLLLVAAVADIFIAGLAFGYIGYDLIHYYLHHGSPKRGSYFDRLRAYHVRHHFESPHLGFGISSKLWDYPFDTLINMSSRKRN